MGFGMFSVQHSPIAIDFGSATVKLLQIGAGDRPPLLAAAEITIPDEFRSDPETMCGFISQYLPGVLREGRFKGRRAVIAVPAAQTFLQHMQINDADGALRDELIKAQLQTQMGCPPQGVVVRPIDVCTVHRNGQSQKEVICFAIARDLVMRYVDLLKKCKLETVGVHTSTMAMIRAFDHIHRRAADAEITTLYIDLGWGGTRAAITHGKQIVFARNIPVGGRHFDQLIAGALKTDLSSARAHRFALRSAKPRAVCNATANIAIGADGNNQDRLATAASGSHDDGASALSTAVATETERRVGVPPPALQHPVPEPGAGESPAAHVDLSELLDTITDEMSMCLRYHQGLFPQRTINRAIFVGGESRQAWLCQHIVKALRVPAQLGDPVARLDSIDAPPTPGVALTPPQPGWAVACGLCASPTDL